jgi:hypothetical protein
VRTALALAVLAVLSGCGGAPSPGPGGNVPADPRALAQGLIPTPIGFRPAAREPAGACSPGRLQGRYRAHVELFARRRAVAVPAGIGLKAARLEYGRVVSAACRAVARTLDPAGVVDSDRELTLGALFAVWGERLSRTRLLSFRCPVSVFVGGRRVTGDPAAVVLRDRAQVVLECGGYIPPHTTFLFPPRQPLSVM